MASVINTNIASLNTQRNLSASQAGLNTSIQRLSSGLRVNSAKDDAAGLAVATRMDSQIRGMNVAIRNSSDAISFAQTAEGALGKVTDSLQRMRELAVQAKNGALSDDDRGLLDKEYQALSEEITRVTDGSKFNGTQIFDGADRDFQVGAGNDGEDTITITGLTAADYQVGGDISDATNAATAIDDIDAALTTLNESRAELGATQNRFEAVIGNLQIAVENQSAAKSRILDADFAAETANLTRGQILQQAGTAMLAQANSAPNGVLALLRG
jgi:flagellin